MDAVDGIHREALEQALLQQEPGARLGRLEDEHGASCEAVAVLAEVVRRAEQHCRVSVMAAGMHLAGVARAMSPSLRLLILNYFRAKKQLSSGVVEGLNNKAKLTMRKSYGFRTFHGSVQNLGV
jgi:Transposase